MEKLVKSLEDNVQSDQFVWHIVLFWIFVVFSCLPRSLLFLFSMGSKLPQLWGPGKQ